MRGIAILFVLCAAAAGERAWAFGIDVGPVHLRTPRVGKSGIDTGIRIGDSLSQKLVVNTITRDEDEKDRVRRLTGNRKGDEGAVYTVKVLWADLDDRSKDLLRVAKEGRTYQVTLKKLDEDWQLEKIRDTDD